MIQIGHYTKNISAALVENHDELVALVAEKVRDDPASRVVGRLPGYDAVVPQVSETTLRVLIEMLGDPRMDELVSDLLRNNLEQIKQAVHEREHEDVPPHPPPDPSPMPGRQRRGAETHPSPLRASTAIRHAQHEAGEQAGTGPLRAAPGFWWWSGGSPGDTINRVAPPPPRCHPWPVLTKAECGCPRYCGTSRSTACCSAARSSRSSATGSPSGAAVRGAERGRRRGRRTGLDRAIPAVRVLAVPAWVWADRLDRKRILIASDAVRTNRPGARRDAAPLRTWPDTVPPPGGARRGVRGRRRLLRAGVQRRSARSTCSPRTPCVFSRLARQRASGPVDQHSGRSPARSRCRARTSSLAGRSRAAR